MVLWLSILVPRWVGYHMNSKNIMALYNSQVIAVSKSSDIVLMVLDASKVSVHVLVVVMI